MSDNMTEVPQVSEVSPVPRVSGGEEVGVAPKDDRVVISTQEVEVRFHVRDRVLTAIRNISLDLYDNEVLAIVGESGSGKSVLTKTFTGMLEANGSITGGHIFYKGQDLTTLTDNADWASIRGKEIATIFQDPMTSLNPIVKIGRQITEVIEKHQGVHGEAAKKLAIELMDQVGIPDADKRFNDYPFEYSGGMRQRIVIAIALACKPKVLICDEPTTALDVTIQAQILELIRSLQREYKFTTIFITHDLGVVANIADKVAVMYAGEIIEYGTVDDIFYDPQHPYTWSLLSSLPQLGEKDQELFSIHGTPPSLFKKIKGDAFAPRNPYALKVDFEVAPPKFQVSPTHWAKTWLLDERAPKIDKPVIIQDLHEKMKAVVTAQQEERELIEQAELKTGMLKQGSARTEPSVDNKPGNVERAGKVTAGAGADAIVTPSVTVINGLATANLMPPDKD